MIKKHLHTMKHEVHNDWSRIKHYSKILLLAGISFIIILAGVLLIWIATLKVPTITSFVDRKISSSTKIYDRTGTVVLYDVHANIKRTVVAADQMSPLIKQAVVAIEDKDFYSHNGIKVSSIIRAGLSNVFPFVGKQSGGSTITQQLVKNTLLTTERSLTRKVKEWVLALKLERIMSKDEILTTYLNEAPYGGTIYGIEEASQSFFGKPAKDIDLTQAAYLAAIPNAPSYYSPYGKNKARLENRKNLVLSEMLDRGMISQSDYDTAKQETIVFRPQQEGSGKALHFVEYIRQYLESKYGTEAVEKDGLKVITTLDWDLQQVGEKAIHENALKNEKDYNASNSALVAVDPKTGQIISMVGSRDYFDRTIDGAFNIATAGRQPGSSFKPIVYARAFEKGFFPETVLFDIPTQFGPCGAFDRSSVSPCYAPDNYDNKFLGPVNLRNALAQSRNVPAVQLLSMIGLPDALETAKRLGVTTLDRDASRYGLTLVLGGGEVSLLDMTSVYGTFGNDGIRNPVTGILEVNDSSGVVLEKYTASPEVVMDPNAARNLSSVLSDNIARTPLFGANSFFNVSGHQVAGKTGTTNSNKDAWVFGYTPSIAVGVWSGNNDNTPMGKGSAISGPAWRTFMDAALLKTPYDRPGLNESFPVAEKPANYNSIPPVFRGAWAGGESFFIDTVSGKLATALTPENTKKEIVIPNPHNILYWFNKNSGQFNRWETVFQNYIANHPNIVPPFILKPVGEDDVHTEPNKPVVSLVAPQGGISTPIPKETPFTLQVATTSKFPVVKWDFYLNHQLIGTSQNGTFTFVPLDSGSVIGQNELMITATDSVYNQGSFTTPLLVSE